MNYEHRSNVQIKRIPTPIKFLGIIIPLLIIVYLFFPHFFSTIFLNIVSPFWNKDEIVNISQTEIPSQLQSSIILELQKENAELKSMLNHRVSSSSVIAYIMKKPPFSAYDSFIVDIGVKSNVKVGDKVYAPGNVLIGEIAEIISENAKVKLYSSYGEKYEVFIGQKSIQATAIGRGGGSFEAVLPRDVKIQEGDIVTIPHLTTSVFGIVSKLLVNPSKTFSTVLFSQPINIYEQKWVEIDI